jgi:subfamily B ATP-binding cassette protein MsbA
LVYKSFVSESFFVAVVGLISVPVLVFPIRRIGIYVAKRSKQLVTLGEAFSSANIESLQSPLEIRAYNLQQAQVQRFVDQLRMIFRLSMKSVRTSLLISPTIEFVSACGIGLSLFLGVRSGMGQGEFLALVIALYMAYSPIKKLGGIHGALKQLEAPLNRLESVLAEPDSVPEAEHPVELPKPVRGAIRFKNVAFDYLKDKPVLKNVSVEIAAGESVGLVGQSGAGKSTFVNLIPRFYEIGRGSIEIDGVDIRQLRLQDLRAQIAYVPQMPMLFNASVADNIRVGRPDASQAELLEAARQANALEFIQSLPNGFDTVLSERGNSLSGGQRQRIAIARAFLKDAPILILDEATSALDNQSDQLIQEALARLAKDRTTLIIAHRMETLNDVHRRLSFEAGYVTAVKN